MTVGRSLYRGVLRELRARTPYMLITDPISIQGFGKGRWLRGGFLEVDKRLVAWAAQHTVGAPSGISFLERLFGAWAVERRTAFRSTGRKADDIAASSRELKTLLRNGFESLALAPMGRSERLDLGLMSLRLAASVAQASERTTVSQSNGVRIEITTLGVEPRFFVYRVRLSNDGDGTVQLSGRQWCFRNADGSVYNELPYNSPGVVGEYPILSPGSGAFEYMSGTQLATDTGTMVGSLQFLRQSQNGSHQELFDVSISPTPLLNST